MSATSDHAPLREDTPTTYYDDLIRIPGMRSPPDRCRQAKPVGVCRGGHVVVGRSSCETRYCPDHWRDWSEDGLKVPLRRLAAYRQVQDGWGRRLVHVVASPPQGRRYSVREFWETRSDAYDAFEAAGVRGGVCVAHAWRTSDAGDELYRAAVEHGDIDVDYGRWRFLREVSEGWDDLLRYIEAAPHYHAIAPSEDVRGDHAPEGWVVDNMGSLSRFEIDDLGCYEEMAQRLGYILSHGAEQLDKMMTTYFGEVHPAAFDPAEELTDEELAKIDEMVEAAVGLDEGHGPEECPHEGCECRVMDLIHLDELLDDDEWVQSVRDHTDGGERLAILRGTQAYIKGLTDRPPPSAQSDPEGLRRWLKRQGALTTDRSNRSPSTRQSTFSPSVVWSL